MEAEQRLCALLFFDRKGSAGFIFSIRFLWSVYNTIENTTDIRRIPVYKLLIHKCILKHFLSFSATVDRCNFTYRSGWGGKRYVCDEGHDVNDYKPDLRGVDILDIYYLRPTDVVVLTEAQYKDYKLISGGIGI